MQGRAQGSEKLLEIHRDLVGHKARQETVFLLHESSTALEKLVEGVSQVDDSFLNIWDRIHHSAKKILSLYFYLVSVVTKLSRQAAS